MKRNCNLELRLFPVTVDPNPDPDQTNEYQSLEEPSKSTGHEQQQLTISSINGKIRVSDVSELQGRAIISVVTREIGERVKTDLISSRCNEISNLSTKMSLQRFLQKRKCRIQATSPYHHFNQ
ncbi:jasmonate ZIM domain protein f [Tripterygium wilfordii]|uniref:Jasmonate ZIM domain protein f n=1 Tax=Tripterygium wilfordii TaxID=458696 RepID=A0A7J7CW23_TRIWF|nr:protein TIFY 5A-like [Tripterygium wilfordii]KAF5738281.1 jasmonate ZIM domain protein f [Tripterygium wilfordii]